MSNILKYKGYLTKIEFSVEDNILYGKIEGIHDLVTFESSSAEEIENEFHAAVDDYLDFCERLGQEPDKTYSGSFNVRISPELHKRVSQYALVHGTTLNQTVETAIARFINEDISDRLNSTWDHYQETSASIDPPYIFPSVYRVSLEQWKGKQAYAQF